MSNLLNIKDQSGNWIPIPVVTNGIKSITQNQDYTLTITLNDGTTYTTTSIKGEDGQDYVLTEQDKQEIAGLVDTPVDDVQINGTSIVENGVATIPIANADNAGVVKVDTYENGYSGGIATIHDKLYIIGGSSKNVKNGYDYGTPIAAGNQHEATFYGLAKVAGHDEKDSTLPVGTYTDEAKASIKNMLGVEDVDIDSKAPVITETATGSIVSFDDGADDMPLQSLIVDINPVQDLHGYDSPWPAGGGKNKCMHYVDRTVTNGITYTLTLDGINVSGTATAASYSWDSTHSTYETALIKLPAGTYTFSANQAPGTDQKQGYIVFMGQTEGGTAISNIVLAGTTLAKTATFSEPVGIYYGIYVARGISVNMTVKLQIESGSTATSWSPYSNECPISGFTGVEVQRTGKNLADEAAIFGTLQGWTSSDGVYTGEAMYIHQTYGGGKGIPGLKFKPSTQYTVSIRYSGASSAVGLVLIFLYTDGTISQRYCNTETSADFQLVSSAGKTIEKLALSYGSNIVVSVSSFQIVEGTTATDYEPYQGTTYPITFPSEVGTVYGAYVDVLNGELVVDRAIVDLGTLWWAKATSGGKVVFYTELYDAPRKSSFYGICSKYKRKQSAPYENNTFILYGSDTFSRIGIRDDMYSESDSTAFKSSLSGTQVVYELAEPIHYPITSNQINSLYGQNNIWADTGNSEVTYRADTGLYIDKQIPDVPVDDVQINGTSIITDGVANIPLATTNIFGVVSPSTNQGIGIDSVTKKLMVSRATLAMIKAGINLYKPLVPANQHESTFYGLAKAAGADEKDSTLPVGTYTDSAKTAIKNMLGVIDGGGTISETITGTDPTITAQNNFRYMCGELYTLNFTPCVSGVCEVIFTSGATPTVLTLPDTVRMPAWWTGVEANTTYEISIVDGVYGAVMSWS